LQNKMRFALQTAAGGNHFSAPALCTHHNGGMYSVSPGSSTTSTACTSLNLGYPSIAGAGTGREASTVRLSSGDARLRPRPKGGDPTDSGGLKSGRDSSADGATGKHAWPDRQRARQADGQIDRRAWRNMSR
jgi:hypothetical protein